MKAFISLIFLLGLNASVWAQLPQDRITWNPEPLSWDNFSGKPDPTSQFHANTSSGISYSWSLRTKGSDTEFIYEVGAFFFPSQSWVKHGKNSDHLLVHEQLHFDITELHARKLRKAMEKFDLKKNKNVKPVLQELYQNNENERVRMQKQFDSETRHSMDIESQRSWKMFIEKELSRLAAYAS